MMTQDNYHFLMGMRAAYSSVLDILNEDKEVDYDSIAPLYIEVKQEIDIINSKESKD